MAFAWQRAIDNPDTLLQQLDQLPDDFHQWPWEWQEFLLYTLRQRDGATGIEQFFNLSLHPAQQTIVDESRRFNVADCGRRFGKSILGEYLVVETLLGGQPASWMSPSYRSLSDAWRDLKRILSPIITEKSEQEHRIEVNTGGVIDCWSLDNPDAPRGRKYKRVVIDEAAMVPYLGEAWQAVIEPTLLDLQGDAWFLSTPKGRNFFATIYSWGQDEARHPEWKSWKLPTTANTTLPHLVEEVERKRLSIPERIFQQEYLAEFIDDAGGVFRRVVECATAKAQARALPDHQYVIGIDWGKLNDFTVLAVIDITTKELVALDRFNQIDYRLQIKRLNSLAKRFETKTLVPERNSIGEPLIEQLQAEGYRVRAFTMTNASKAELIDGLTLAFEQSALRILDVPVLIDELQAYEAERLPSGLLRYSAPEGYHDDCVIAVALAWHGAHLRVADPDEAPVSTSWHDYF